MPSRGVDESGGAGSDPVFDGEEYASDYGLPVVVAEEGADAEDKDVLSPLWADDDDDGGGAKESWRELGGGDVECPICGKLFKNDKALFGHLRSHPNRGYKGATPPEKKLKLSPGTDDDVLLPASSSLPGIDGSSGQCSGRHPLLTPLEILCACFMLTLRCRAGKAAQQATPPLPHRSLREGKLVDEKTDDAGFGGGGLVTTSSSVAAQVKTEDPLPCDGSFDAIIPPKKRRRRTCKEDSREASSSSSSKKVKVKLVTTTTPKEKRPYTCKHCKAEFSTNQALGGHMSGHHREKKAPPPALYTKEASPSEHQSMLVQSQAIGGADEPSCAGLSLSTNRMQFEQLPSMGPDTRGQAPRGRLKLHFVRRNRGIPPVETPAAAAGNAGDRRRPLNIDLNIEAPEQE
jgi:hypothetical protein